MKKSFSEALASLVVAMLFGAAAFVIMGWFIQLTSDWMTEPSKVLVQGFVGCVFGGYGFLGRINRFQ